MFFIGIENFGQRLHQLRTRKGLSGKVLGELCGLGKNAVRQYERGEKSPSAGTLCALADYFGVSNRKINIGLAGGYASADGHEGN